MIGENDKGVVLVLSKKNIVLSLTANILIVIATIGVVISYFCGNDGEYHIPPTFRFCLFTTDSNILCMLTALILACFEVRYLVTGKAIPKLAVWLKFVGSTAVAVTFSVVVLFLGPMTDFVSMVFGGTSVYMHFAGPLLGFVSFCFWENIHPVSKKMLLPALVPTLIYGIVYLVMVVAIGSERGGWIDFYGFNIGGFWYLTCLAIWLLTLGLAAILRLIHNRMTKTASAKTVTQQDTH